MSTDSSLWSLLPPIVVLILGYRTHRVILSLAVGVLLACLIATRFSLLDALSLSSTSLWINCEFHKFFSSDAFWETWNLFIFIFLFILGIFVTLMQSSGGIYAYGNFIKRYIKDKKSAETASLVLSTILFVDDYFSSLTVGAVMRPLTDSYRVARAKLSFLVDSMAAPMAILCPFSSWVAALLGFFRENGVSEFKQPTTFILASPLTTYFYIIPFIFYSFLLVVAMWFIVRCNISLGSMRKHERIAKDTGHLYGGLDRKGYTHDKVENAMLCNPSIWDFVFPIFLLLVSIICGLLFSGDWWVFGGSRSTFSAFQYSSAAIGLFIGGNVALGFTTAFLVARKRIEFAKLPGIFWEGICLMLPAVVVLLLAWTLGDVLRNQLHTGEYLANLLIGTVDITFLPTILFFTSSLIAFALGSAWGTAAMMFPIAIPMAIVILGYSEPPTLAQAPILLPTLGAVLAGCVAGDHISPISDTTIMSVTSTKTPLMDHVSTQLPYAIPIILITGFVFYIASLLISHGIWFAAIVSISLGIVLVLLTFIIANKFNSSRASIKAS